MVPAVVISACCMQTAVLQILLSWCCRRGRAGVLWLPLNAFAQLTPQSLRLRVRRLACEIVFPAKACVLAARPSPPVSRVLSVSVMTMFD